MNRFKTTLIQGLFHAAIAWLLVNAGGLLSHYILAGHRDERMLSYLIRHSIEPQVAVVLIYILSVEFCHEYVFKVRDLLTFSLFCVLCGLLFTSGFMAAGGVGPGHPGWRQAGVAFFLFAGYNFVYSILREFFHQRLHSREVRHSREATRLQALKKQLDPHFLFNTLNYLYSTALREQAAATADGIQLMSALMRYTQAGMQDDSVPLRDDLDFIGDYLKLQQLRLAPQTLALVNVRIEVLESGLAIAPMLLIPFIENAFQYGISNDHPAPIDISITADETGLLTMRVGNASLRQAPRGSGRGISLTRQRLQLLYPGRHSLSIEQHNGMFQVALTIGLR